MTQKEFVALLFRLEPKMKDVDGRTPLSSVAFVIAGMYWVLGDLPTTPDQKLLARELHILLKTQKFSWQGDSDEPIGR